ncbi:hypothetical protein [Stutzerimonas xanthomarina]|uniref:hypothetical protein n=1 Tax=Stutzerimonas xanthomarina TaxID=271420 RepID=UPI003AA99A71
MGTARFTTDVVLQRVLQLLEEQRITGKFKELINGGERFITKRVDSLLAGKALIDSAYDQAKVLLKSRCTDLEQGVRLLLEKESLIPETYPALRPFAVSPSAAELP